MKECDFTEGATVSFCDRPPIETPVAGLAAAGVSALIALVLYHESAAVTGWAVVLAALIVAVAASAVRRSCTEINRECGIVRRYQKTLLSRKEKTYQLADFHTVTLVERMTAPVEGYSIPLYTIVLQGNSERVELQTYGDGAKARLLQQKLVALLCMRAGQ